MKRVFLFVLAVLSFSISFAQTDTLKTKTDSTSVAQPATTQEQPKQKRDNRPLKERIAFGFGTGFWINTNTTYIELCPVVAYRFPKALVTGVGYRYIYRNQRLYGVDLNSWGPDFFARLQLLKRVYMWTEYEILTSQYLAEVGGADLAKQKATSDALFAGLGFIRSVGKRGRGGISIQVLYNFFYERDDYSPYYSPVTYRVGYYF
jgi:hypothetical protein